MKLLITPELVQWRYYTDPNTMKVLTHLALQSETPIRISVRHMAQVLGLSYRNVRTALKHIKDEGIITISGTNSHSIITFSQWHSLKNSLEVAHEVAHENTPQNTGSQPHKMSASTPSGARSGARTRERPARLSSQYSSGPTQQDLDYINNLLTRK